MAQTLIEKKNGDVNTVNELDISSEFLDESKKFSQTKKRGGRYSKMTRILLNGMDKKENTRSQD